MPVKHLVEFYDDAYDSYPARTQMEGDDNLAILQEIIDIRKVNAFHHVRFYYGPEYSWQWFELWWLESGKLCPDRTSSSIWLSQNNDASVRLAKIWGDSNQPNRYRLEAQVIRLHEGKANIYYFGEKRVPRAQLKLAAPVWNRVPDAWKWAEENFPEGVFRGF